MATRSLWRLTVLLLAVAPVACTSLDMTRDGDVAAEVTAIEASARRVPAPETNGPVVALPAGAAAWLVEDARGLAAAGNWERAAAQIERAMRIERDNPWLYLELARIRIAQGEPAQGDMLLNRARALSAGDPRIEARALALGAAVRTGSSVP